MELSAFSYKSFVDFALQQAQLKTTLTPLPSQVSFAPLLLSSLLSLYVLKMKILGLIQCVGSNFEALVWFPFVCELGFLNKLWDLKYLGIYAF